MYNSITYEIHPTKTTVFLGFLSTQQHQVKYNQEQNWDCDQILQMLRHQTIFV
jgi:hypothetical protein